MATKMESWEVQAFEKDRSNAMGATWPPRSYTCSFCRREFRSAQALGGHMNVHRRDRARLRLLNSSHALDDGSKTAPVFFSASSNVVRSNGTGLCLFYPIHGICYEQEVGCLNASSFGNDGRICKKTDNGSVEELDLELRLGW